VNILGKEYNELLFVHIPKTAGTSISEILNYNKLDNWNRGYPRHHDPYFYLKDNNKIDDKVFSFSVVRNPYTRTYSCYKQFNKSNKTDISFITYLNNILEKKISAYTPLLHLPQSFYIIGDDNKIQVTKLYKFENLKELEDDLSWKIKLINVGYYTKEKYAEDYNDIAIDIVKKLYKFDFLFFGYSMNFNSTLEKNEKK
jgi:hypothetical protein